MRIKGYFAPDMRQALRMIREEMGPDAVILSHHQRTGGVEITAAVDFDHGWLETGARDGSGGRGALLAHNAQTHIAAEPGAGERKPEPLRAASEKGALSDAPVSGGGAALAAMGQEIKALRRLLEHQLSGIAWGELNRQNPLQATLLRHLLELGFSHRIAQSLTNALPATTDLHSAWRLVLGILAHRLSASPDDVLTGGGIVALSHPEMEFRETLLKAKALIHAMVQTIHGNFESDKYEILAGELQSLVGIL